MNLVDAAEVPCRERGVGAADGIDHRLQRNAVKRHTAWIWRDPDLLWAPTDDEGETNVLDLGQLGLQLFCDQIERLIVPAVCGCCFRSKRNHDDGNVADAPPNDQWLGNAGGDLVIVGADPLVDAQDGVIAIRSYHETGCDKDAIILCLAIDMLDAVDGLDDGLERLGNQFSGIGRLEAIGAHRDIHHRHADLRLFLPRNGEQGQQAKRDRREQEKWRQRRANGRLCQLTRNAEFHDARSTCRMTSPARRPDRISTPSGMSSSGTRDPRCTGASIVAPPFRLSRT